MPGADGSSAGTTGAEHSYISLENGCRGVPGALLGTLTHTLGTAASGNALPSVWFSDGPTSHTAGAETGEKLRTRGGPDEGLHFVYACFLVSRNLLVFGSIN